ncbi:unnamed protein product (macronuclear) [Paramecium tetraurelia]|uniref:Uncharacterized protein n=1 Tax=Paramecium tetraurelia TaxID=5888 RepID=A0DGL6_PARTE|nr:uncharacterized protein GSPATT00002312001 [Paramecium tetraurelia]CAK82183.1 unnamed protein product [Paramecium tetraurelia]|eukprot:XP_001449580.1 hypothetical protein (macronuclear) [Paramecium tetraurelia strain d4-2]
MQSKYEQNDDEILCQNDDDGNGEIINFEQFDEDEQNVITPVEKSKQQIQQTFGDQFQVQKEKEDEEQVIEDIVQFMQDEEQDNVANFGSMHRDEDFQSWKDENKQNDQNEQVQQTNQIDAMTERQEQQAQIIYQPGMIIDMKEFLQKPIDQCKYIF